MNSISAIFGLLMLVVIIFTGMQVVGEQVVDNSNLDATSVALIGNYSDRLNNEINATNDFGEFQTNLSTNSSYDSADDFSREFLEGRNEGNKKQGFIARAIKIPDLVILSLGVPQLAVAWVRNLILLIITTWLSFAAYRAFFGSGKVTEK
jgi:flagellin-like protein